MKICPECMEVFEDWVEVCSDCGPEKVRLAVMGADGKPIVRIPEAGDEVSIPEFGEAEALAAAEFINEGGIACTLRPKVRHCDYHAGLRCGPPPVFFDLVVSPDDLGKVVELLEQFFGLVPGAARTAEPSCPACGHEISAELTECPDCGLSLVPEDEDLVDHPCIRFLCDYRASHRS